MICYRPLAALFLSLMLFATQRGAAYAQETSSWNFDDKENRVEFQGRAGLFTIDGAWSKVEGSLLQVVDKVAGVLTVDLRPLRTGIELRDSHMHQKYLQTGPYPRAELALGGVAAVTAKWTDFCGDLKVKTDTQRVCGKYFLSNDGVLEASFELSLEKIPSLGIPAWAGATMSDTVKVDVKARVARK